MIKLQDGELRDYLPATMKNDTEMICLSYALKKATERLLEYQRASMVYSFIDGLPEQILDVLAVELRSLYYSDTMPIETKRAIVKNTLKWHSKAGTPWAVAEMVKIVFGEGDVVEWFDFDEPPFTPGTFDIVTNSRLTPDIVDYFAAIIDRVKNVRSHLRRILIKREWNFTEYAASGAVSKPSVTVTNNAAARNSGIELEETAAPAVTSSPHEQITNNAAPRESGAQVREYASAGIASVPHEQITNNMAARASPLPPISEYGGAVAAAAPKEVATNNMGERQAAVRQGPAYAGAVSSASPRVGATNTKPPAQSAARACGNAAILARSTPRVEISGGGTETSVWLEYGAQAAAAVVSHPKIII